MRQRQRHAEEGGVNQLLKLGVQLPLTAEHVDREPVGLPEKR